MLLPRYRLAAPRPRSPRLRASLDAVPVLNPCSPNGEAVNQRFENRIALPRRKAPYQMLGRTSAARFIASPSLHPQAS